MSKNDKDKDEIMLTVSNADEPDTATDGGKEAGETVGDTDLKEGKGLKEEDLQARRKAGKEENLQAHKKSGKEEDLQARRKNGKEEDLQARKKNGKEEALQAHKKSGIRDTFRQLLRGEIADDDEPLSGDITLNKIFGGDILSTNYLQRQIWVILLIAAFIVVYISNRYSCQRSQAEIATLTLTLQEEKYKALSINSQLTEMTRESHVLEYLRESKDSVLHIATQPPYIINVPNEENQQ